MRARAFILMLFAALNAMAQVSYERLLKAGHEPENWLTYSGDYRAHHFSELKEVDRSNVKRLSVQWVFQSAVLGKFEATPLVVDGMMYVTGPDNVAYGLDARTGRRVWRYVRALPEKVRPCCGRVNRGFAIVDDRLFMSTLDAHVIALDRKTGNVLWDTDAADYTQGNSFTVAPLVVKDKVIVGISGGEYGIRGFIDAYDTATGKRAWRFYTVPAKGEKGSETWQGEGINHGGAPAWVTGAYDPELNLLYWPTGNPSPSNYGGERGGDNLYSNCMLALNPDTGHLKWYFQFTPHDLHDWDATEIPVLLDTEVGGKPRQLLLQADRNGFFYALDRASGEFIFAKPFARQTWAKEMSATGRPVVISAADPTDAGVRACPGAIGATNFMSPSYSPQTGLFYVEAREQCDVFSTAPQRYQAGRVYIGSAYNPAPNEKDWGALRAIDPRTGDIKWEFKRQSAGWAGALATAGGLVFTGDIEGYFMAIDAQTGKDLWHFQTGSAIYAAPITYRLDGRQYVAIASGTNVVVFALAAD